MSNPHAMTYNEPQLILQAPLAGAISQWAQSNGARIVEAYNVGAGGYEVWCQVEIAMMVRQFETAQKLGKIVEREAMVFTGAKQASKVDFAVLSPKIAHVVELKVEGHSVDTFVSNISMDIDKVIEGRYKPILAGKPAVCIAIAVTQPAVQRVEAIFLHQADKPIRHDVPNTGLAMFVYARPCQV